MAGRLGRGRAVPRRAGPDAAEVLRAGDVPVPLGAHPHGARAQLHHGRRDRPLQARPRLQRAAPDGFRRLRHAGGERRHREGRAAGGVDLPEHRGDAGADEADGLLARLEPRARHLRPGVLRPAAGAVPRHAGGRAGRAEVGGGQLGPGRHDGARQRAGDRRQGLALRRPGRAARAGAVVLPHLRHGRGAARGARRAGALAREGARHAAQLDRQEPRAAVPLRDPRRDRAGGAGPRDARGLHHPPRHALGRELRRRLAGAPAGQGAGGRPGGRGVPRRVPADGHQRGGARDRREEGLRHRHPGGASASIRPGRCRSTSRTSS